MMPQYLLIIPQGRFQSPCAAEAKMRTKIEAFLIALAASHDEHSIAIALSGSVSEAIERLHALKAADVLAITQDSKDAVHDSIPNQLAHLADPGLALPIAETPDVLRRDAK